MSKFSLRRMQLLPKVPKDFVRDTSWGHAMYRKEYSKIVHTRSSMLRLHFKVPKWVYTWNNHTKRMWWDIKP